MQNVWMVPLQINFELKIAPFLLIIFVKSRNLSYEPSPLKFVIFRKDKRSHEIYGSSQKQS